MQWRIAPFLAVDGFVKRHRDQISLEAVKDYSDAQVETWYGSQLFRLENPGTSIDMYSYHSGLSSGGGLTLLENNIHWEAYIGAETGSDGANFKKGNKYDAADRGYENRSVNRCQFWLQRKLSTGSISLYSRYHAYEEWTRPAYYQSLMAENNGTLIEGGLQIIVHLHEKIETGLWGQVLAFDENYSDYLGNIENEKKVTGWRAGIETRVDPWPILSFNLALESQRLPLNYTWQYDYADRNSIKLAGEYQFGLTRIIPSIRYTIEYFDDTNYNNNSIEGGISLSR